MSKLPKRKPGRPKGRTSLPTLKSSHQWLAFMDARGDSVRTMATATGLTQQAIFRLRRMPLYIALKAEHIEHIIEHGMKEAIAHLISDAPANLAFVKQIREGDWDDDPDRMKLRLEAARELLGHQFPKKSQVEGNVNHAVRVSHEHRTAIEQDCDEAGVALQPIPLAQAISDARAAYPE